jgi:hypothetical protein
VNSIAIRQYFDHNEDVRKKRRKEKKRKEKKRKEKKRKE